MSTRPAIEPSPSTVPVTRADLAEKKRLGEPIVMVTAYDCPTAQVAEAAGVDVVLVGDSGGMTALGYSSTVAVSLEEMLMLAAAVRRGCKTPLLVGGLPFGSYEASDTQAVTAALRFIKEAGCDAVKLEGGGPTSLSRVRSIVAAGILVMGHIGLTGQTARALGGYCAQGRTAARALDVVSQAQALQDAGCFALVIEAVPAAVVEELMPLMRIPVIGIGAGGASDGQVLVVHDLLGIYSGRAPRFAKHYAQLRDQMVAAVTEFADEVRERRFPTQEHTYSIDPTELAELRKLMAAR